MITVMIADDHAIFREGLRGILDADPDLAVVGEASDSREALAKAVELEPNVLLLDVRMPGRGALEVIKELRRRELRIAILVLTAQPEDRYAVQVLKAGADGYVTKESGQEELKGAIRRVHRGGRYIGPKLAEELALAVSGRGENAHDLLSDRERQVLMMIAEGRSIHEIAADLALSPKTVSTYRTRMLEKLGLKNNSEVVRYAMKLGLVE